jgi:hypothetical protein
VQGCQIFCLATIPKREKYTKLPQLYQMAVKYPWPYVCKIFQHFPFEGPPKFTKLDFSSENIPSGNPVAVYTGLNTDALSLCWERDIKASTQKYWRNKNVKSWRCKISD